MRPTDQDLFIDISTINSTQLLNSWKWLIGNNKQLFLISTMGDAFLKDRSGKIYWLDVGVGKLEQVAENESEFQAKLSDDKIAEEWLLFDLVNTFKKQGLFLSDKEVFSYQNPPALGGKFEPQNFKKTDVEVHFHIFGQILQKVIDLPEGTKIGKVEFKEPIKSDKKWKYLAISFIVLSFALGYGLLMTKKYLKYTSDTSLYHISYSGNCMIYKWKRNGKISSKYCDENGDGVWDEMATYSKRGILLNISYDADNDENIEKSIDFDKKGNQILVSEDKDENGRWEITRESYANGMKKAGSYDTNTDGEIDHYYYYSKQGRLVEKWIDRDFNRVFDQRMVYDNQGKLTREELDENNDGTYEIAKIYKSEKLVKTLTDTDNDGIYDF